MGGCDFSPAHSKLKEFTSAGVISRLPWRIPVVARPTAARANEVAELSGSDVLHKFE